MTPNRQETLKWRMTNAAIAIAKASVTPILKMKDGQLLQEGTGTLFQIGAHKLLVTAAHVFDDILKNGWKPLLLDAGNENEQIKEAPLLGRTESCGDPWDVSVTLLDARTTDRLPHRVYLSMNVVDLGTVYPGAFCVGGFPVALGIGTPDNKTLGGCMICTKLYTGSRAAFSGFDPNFHILIDRMEERGSTDAEGKPVAIPDSLGGASGSPLFQTYRDGNPFDAWTPADIRVVGVVTWEWREAMMATRWAAVLACAYEGFPELHDDLVALGMVPNRVPVPAAVYW
jgi:hypothetical protein